MLALHLGLLSHFSLVASSQPSRTTLNRSSTVVFQAFSLFPSQHFTQVVIIGEALLSDVAGTAIRLFEKDG